MMPAILQWLIPIAVGSVIGFITNDIAIKMLFRPLKEKRIFGIRVPFTPGILPRNRHRLAVSLGNTVSSQLLNEEVLSKRFRADDFKSAITRSVDSLLEDMLGAKLESFRFAENSIAYGRVSAILRKLIEVLFGSGDFEAFLLSALRKALDGIGGMKVGDLLGNRDSLAAAAGLIDLILSDGGSRRIRDKAEDSLDSWLGGERPALDFLPLDPSNFATNAVKALYPEALRIFLDFLRTPAMRAELAVNGREIVSSLLKRLNPFQRLVVAAARYDQAIKDNMEATVADLITHLELIAAKIEVRDLLAQSAAKSILEWAALKPEDLLKRLPDARERILRLLDGTLNHLTEPGTREKVINALSGAIDGLKEKRVSDIVEKGLGIGMERIESMAGDLALGLVRREGSEEGMADAIASFASNFVEARREMSVGEILGLGKDFREGIRDFLAEKAISVIEGKVGEIMRTVDVRRTVEEKIDSLDILALEKIVLDVMKEQFAWINIFGALLGAIIGLVQAIIGAFG